jgi:hypothetical protein
MRRDPLEVPNLQDVGPNTPLRLHVAAALAYSRLIPGGPNGRWLM